MQLDDSIQASNFTFHKIKDRAHIIELIKFPYNSIN